MDQKSHPGAAGAPKQRLEAFKTMKELLESLLLVFEAIFARF